MEKNNQALKCPVCKVPLKEDVFYDDHILIESYEACENGCKKYGYNYAYGNWSMKLGETVLEGHHADSKTVRKKRAFIYKRKLARMRKNEEKPQIEEGNHFAIYFPWVKGDRWVIKQEDDVNL